MLPIVILAYRGTVTILKEEALQLYIKDLDELHYLKGLLSMQPCQNPTDEAYSLMTRVDSLIMQKGPFTKPCGYCGETMQLDKNCKNRRFCSGKCRVAAHRRKEKDRQQAIGTQKVSQNL